MFVYVISKNGKKLMPTSPCNARLLLKSKRAKVVNRCPFTIQLLYDTSEYTQPVRVGIDDGAKTVGVAAIGNGKVYFAANLNLRTDIHEKISSRQEARRSRRNRLRYRKPRFLNRKRQSLPPSIKGRKDEIIRGIKRLPLPIEEIILEDVQVDIRKIVTPKVEGFGYQESNKLDENLRKAIVIRDNCECKNKKCSLRSPTPSSPLYNPLTPFIKGEKGGRACPDNSGGVVGSLRSPTPKACCEERSNQTQRIKRLEVHHIIHKEDGGPDTPENLITLCEFTNDEASYG